MLQYVAPKKNKLYQGLRGLLFGRKKPAWLLEGRTKPSGEHLRVLYLGEKKNRRYFQKLVFHDGVAETHQGDVAAGDLELGWRSFTRGVDLVVIKTENEVETLRRQRFFAVPCWVEVIQNTSVGTCASPICKSLREDLRTIRKHRYTYEVTSDQESFDDFYYNFYLPYTLSRHEQSAMPIKHEQMVQQLSRSELLKVQRDGTTVAACMMVYGDREVHSWKIGVRNGDQRLVREGATAAAYLFQSQYLAARGWNEVNLGGTRAFPADGQFQYKKKWGIRLGRVWDQRFYLKPLRPSAGAEAFLENNPFLHVPDNRCVVAAAVKDPREVTQQEIDRLVMRCSVAGIDRIDVYGLQGDWEGTGIGPTTSRVELSTAAALWES